MTLASGTRLGRYEIQETLGIGGMGEVYRALDTRLERAVALKVLPDAVAHDTEALQRFEREARAVAALSHPNILAIHDLHVEGGACFAVMELLEGSTLRAMLAAGAFPWRQAIDIAAGVADGLAAAHARGIVHRDIKPENIFVTSDDRVKILDFGLARLDPLLRPPGDASLAPTLDAETTPGTLLGTIGYMAPEQVRGLPADARSDIFALGCVLYEMAAGSRAFAGRSAAEILASILRDEPEPLAGRSDLPPELGVVVLRCLDKRPESRYQSARDLALDLRALASAPTLRVAPAAPRTDRPLEALAVLPFDNAASGAETEYLADGITDNLIAGLSRLPGLRITARSLAFRYKGKGADPLSAGRQLGVGAVLVGSVAPRGDDLLVRAELVDTANGARLWGEEYGLRGGDVLSLQEQILRALSEHLHAGAAGEGKKLRPRQQTENSEAYRLYLKGRYHWNKRPRDTKRGMEYFQRAIDEDPLFPLPYAGLADCYATLGSWEAGGLAPREAFPRARAAAARALEIEPDLAEAYPALAYTSVHYDWDWAEAERLFARAIELDPQSPHAHHWYSHLLMSLGRVEESLAESRRALEADPLDLIINAHLAWHHWLAREPEAGIAQCRRTLEMEPNDFWSPFFLGLLLESKADFAGAVEQHRLAAERTRGSDVMLAALGHAQASAGDRAAAEAVLGVLEESSNKRYVSSYSIALIHVALDRLDSAFRWLERALEERDSWLVYANVEPRLDPLRPDARFSEICRRVGWPRAVPGKPGQSRGDGLPE